LPSSTRPHRPPASFVATSLPAVIDVVAASSGRVDTRIHLADSPPISAFATNASERVAYIEGRSSRCTIQVGSVPLAGPAGQRRLTVRPVATIRGGVVDDLAARPALSPDGRRLALVVASGLPAFLMGVGRACLGPSEIVIVNLSDGSQRVWRGDTRNGTVESLEWAPDSRHLAFAISGLDSRSIAGTHVLDIQARGSSYLRTRRVLPETPQDDQGRPAHGPLFWWHGSKVVVENRGLMVVEQHRTVASRALHPPVGLPADAAAVSVAANGTDLLIQDGHGETWWWDGRTSRRVPDPPHRRWSEPAW
jgi:hypothetical protein